jgi:hypothetical protein
VTAKSATPATRSEDREDHERPIDLVAALPGAWAADLRAHHTITWLAWTACADDEAGLFTRLDGSWPLRPGLTVDDWRARTRRGRFTLSAVSWPSGKPPLSSGPDGPGPRNLAKSAHAFEGPAVALDGDDAWVVWAERGVAGADPGNAAAGMSLRAARCAASGAVGTPETIASSAVAIHGPRVASHPSGAVWVVWQEWSAGDERPAIMAGRRDGHRWSDPVQVSEPGASSWAPAVAVDAAGGVWVVWDALVGGGRDGGGGTEAPQAIPGTHPYHLFLRYRDPAGRWSEAQRVVATAASPSGLMQVGGDVAVDREGRAWIVWCQTPVWGVLNYRLNHTKSLHAAVATVAGSGPGGTPRVRIAPPPGPGFLDEPGQLPVASIPFATSNAQSRIHFINPAAPRLVPTDRGMIVVFRRFRSAGLHDFGWTLDGILHDGSEWGEPVRLSTAAGFPDTPFGAATYQDGDAHAARGGGHLLLAYHALDSKFDPGLLTALVPPDVEVPEGAPFTERLSFPAPNSRLVVERAASPEAPHPAHQRHPASFTVPTTAHFPAFELPPAWAARPADQTAPVADPKQTPDPATDPTGPAGMALLFGDLHRHSAYSRCAPANDGDPLDHWRWACDVGGLDFYCLTEHIDRLSYAEWRRIEDLSASLRGGPVIPLLGFELAIPPGHTNFFYMGQSVGHDLRVAALAARELADVWPRLDDWVPARSVLAIRHAQGHRGELFASYAPRYEPLIELIQLRGEFRHWAHALLAAGFRVGFAGATDHSTGTQPFVHCVTGVWADTRDAAGLWAALWARRTFATNGPHMRVWLESNAGVMGDGGVLGAGEPVTLRVRAAGTAPLETVEYYRDGRLVHVDPVAPGDGQDGPTWAASQYVDSDSTPGNRVYYARVTQRQGREPAGHAGIAVASPVFITVT